jgi:hypothetical protein
MSKGFDVLRLIQDVDWVVGSFIVDPTGELLVYLTPPEFEEEALRRTASRLASIVRSAELCGVEVDQCDLSLSRYQLVVHRNARGMVCVLVEAPVSRRALSMATRIALEELPRLIDGLDSEGPRSSEFAFPPESEARSLPQERFGPVASVTRNE